jgi:hypothetical protein
MVVVVYLDPRTMKLELANQRIRTYPSENSGNICISGRRLKSIGYAGEPQACSRQVGVG